MKSYTCTDVDSGGVTVDAKQLILNFTTETDALGLNLPVETVPKLLALTMGLMRDAKVSESEARLATAFDVFGVNIIGQRSDPQHLFLEVKLQSDAPGLILRIPRAELRQAAQAFLRMEGSA